MGKIRKSIPPHWLTISAGKPLLTALEYIERGDQTVLASIKKTRGYDMWRHVLAGAMNPPATCDEEDLRALQVLARSGAYSYVAEWTARGLSRKAPVEETHALLKQTLEASGMSGSDVATLTAGYIRELHQKGQPNSAGRYILGLSDTQLHEAVAKRDRLSSEYSPGGSMFEGLLDFLFAVAPDHLDAIVPQIVDPKHIDLRITRLVLERVGRRFEALIATSWRNVQDFWRRFVLSKYLVERNPEAYKTEALALTRSDLQQVNRKQFRTDEVFAWMLSTYGKDVLDDVLHELRTDGDNAWHSSRIVNAAASSIGKEAVPAFVLLAGKDELSLKQTAAGHLIQYDDGTHAELIRTTLQTGLDQSLLETKTSYGGAQTPDWLKLIARWRPALFEDQIWQLSDHRSKPLREAAARTLGRIGDPILSRVIPLLHEKKKDRRSWAVSVLSTVGTPGAMEAMEARLDDETDDDVRDAMLLVLDSARAASGRQVTRADIDNRVSRSAKKLKTPVATWLEEHSLPTLRFADGTPLGPETVRFLLYRQSRAREMSPDVEAKPLYAMIDRATSGDFALALFQQFADTKADAADRWVLAVIGMLGDDRVVPGLNGLIQEWTNAARGKMAEYGVQSLAMLNTDVALTTVDALALRYRTKNKNIGAAAMEAFNSAAERRGISVDELGDLVVPWLGFQPGRQRIIDCAGNPFEIMISSEWKLCYRDLKKNKPVASLPKSAPKEAAAELKTEALLLKDVVKGQKARLENLMVRQQRWPAARWRELFLNHPVLIPFASRLIWGDYDEKGTLLETFRALDDRSLTTPADEPHTLCDLATVGMVHPLELDEAARAAWRTHLADYEISPPFPQLDRPVIRASDDQRERRISREIRGTSLNAMTFRGRAEKLGWTRGSVNDGGSVDAYRKVFPGAAVEAFLGIEGLYMYIDRDASITLEDYAFVRGGSVRVSGYTYDRPTDESDPRLIAFGEVPPVVFSEVMGDLSRITGKQAEEGTEAAG